MEVVIICICYSIQCQRVKVQWRYVRDAGILNAVVEMQDGGLRRYGMMGKAEEEAWDDDRR